MTNTRNEMLTRDVSQLLEVTPSAVSRMVKRGELKPLRVIDTGRAGVFVFSRSSVDKLKRSRDDRARRRAEAEQAAVARQASA